jgi:hypothetical protein
MAAGMLKARPQWTGLPDAAAFVRTDTVTPDQFESRLNHGGLQIDASVSPGTLIPLPDGPTSSAARQEDVPRSCTFSLAARGSLRF